ncbi:ParB/RepB/Spo0J family partition protein [Collimonas sp.]|jgi:ParB/RepB/Spo0J family partition protein|uniref:ParB/RepB/Spo0J family partition protein n=1 Tax=Collimonas sp. TaxID=1963772 RepID=UPI002BEB1F85|nr:ParB N-terminal domain-containing protein [Collimonas sp.]HWX01389.1 ParB N-terminal domain-containing protein [Collimonas sp.]
MTEHMTGAVSLKVLAERKIDGVQKTTRFQVDPRIIEIEPGFNGRPIDQEHVDSIKASIKAGAELDALVVRVEDGRIILVDGHHRLTAILQLIVEGVEILRIDARQFRGNDAERIAHMLTSAQGKPLTPLEQGLQYRKLIGFGWTNQEVASKVGKSANYVSQMLTLAESNSDVQGMVARKEVAAHVALEVVKKHGSGAGKVLAGHLETARSAGKTKVTKKTVAPTQSSDDTLRIDWLDAQEHIHAQQSQHGPRGTPIKTSFYDRNQALIAEGISLRHAIDAAMQSSIAREKP